MGRKNEVVTVLKAYVDTPDGMVAVKRGDPLPDNILDGEAERVRALGALGEPATPPVPGAPADEAAVLTAALTEQGIVDYVRDHSIKDIVDAVGEDVELAKKVLVAEADATGNESRAGLVKALQAVIQDDSGGAPADEAAVKDE
jgi:hypothetical protein